MHEDEEAIRIAFFELIRWSDIFVATARSGRTARLPIRDGAAR